MAENKTGNMITATDRQNSQRQLLDAQASFLDRNPSYRETLELDALRASDYQRLDAAGHAYVDYTGGGLYAESQLRKHHALLQTGIFGNPHSLNPTSRAMTRLVEHARAKVLEFFRASPDEYAAIFTGNASGALKLVGEAYPFAPGGHYLLTFDNHNSVNGIREFARARGASLTYLPMALPELRLDEGLLDRLLALGEPGCPKLFAYPAQSNFSGVQHPLEYIERAREAGWDVMLDAAAFVPTNRLDLSRYQPDFVALSFYKMFGYPTGVGCLLARHAALRKLQRPWFAGGTITVASVQGDRYFLAPGSSAFEDGTLDYLGIPAVEIGLRHLGPRLDTVHQRVMCLTGWLLEELSALRHKTGAPLIRLYGPANAKARGGTITMNFRTPSGELIDHQRIEELASRRRISLRTGCFCNPGGGEVALELTKNELANCLSQPAGPDDVVSYDDFRRCIGGKGAGAVRVSLGIASNFADAWRFVQFASELRA